MSAQVTEAHRTLARRINPTTWTSSDRRYSPEQAAQLIADSEARAVTGQNAVIAEWLNRVAVVSAERDQLRAKLDNANAEIRAVEAERNTLLAAIDSAVASIKEGAK